ncbi:MAG: response regulator [Reyranella sp.]|nr:response regulator [Reyranella sp.]
MTVNPARRLLVVDDESEILAEVAGYLRRRGETVVTASSYRQGLQALEDDAVPIDILITDGRMPDGSGIELLRAAIKRPAGPHAFILMTGHFEESDLTVELQEAGVIVIHKPFSLSALHREVGAAWDTHRRDEPTVEPVHVGVGEGR